MRLPINDNFSGIIQNTLSRTGSIILFSMLKESAERAESILDKNELPEIHRIRTKYSHVVATKDYSYCFTLERLKSREWALTAFIQEEAQKPQTKAITC